MQIKSMKKRTLVVLAIALAAVIAVGGTLAYLATKTEIKNNVFTFADNIKGKLDEPNWNPNDAKNLTPGYEVKKDPMFTNTSDNGVDEYAAIQLTFTNGAGVKLSAADTVKLLNCLNITWNPNWELMDGTLTTAAGVVTAATPQQTYVYKNVLTPGQVSDPVFSSVTIKSDISDADYAWLAGIITNHIDTCYTYSPPATYDHIVYKHHSECALEKAVAAGVLTQAQVDAAAKGAVLVGTDGKNYTCDCTPATEYADAAGNLIPMTATLIVPDPNGHTVPAGAISGFQINVQGAAVQAGVDGMTAYNAAATTANLKALLPIV